MQLLFGFLGGGILGGGIVWFLLSAKMQAVREKTKNGLIADRASMMEQRRGKEQQVKTLRQEVTRRDRTLTAYQTQLTQAAEKSARLETQLSEAPQQATERLALITTVQQQFSDTFKALSSEALQANNQSFLKLAEANLSRFQTAASRDLALKQQAIEEVVQPLKSSLTKVETYLQTLEGQRVAACSQLTEQADWGTSHQPGSAIEGNGESSKGIAIADCTGSLGRNSAQASRRDCWNGGALRFHTAGHTGCWSSSRYAGAASWLAADCCRC